MDFKYLLNLSNYFFIWKASYLVWPTTNQDKVYFYVIWLSTDNTKIAVFPIPDFDCAKISTPISASGKVYCWTS